MAEQAPWEQFKSEGAKPWEQFDAKPAPFIDLKKAAGNIIPDIKNIGSAGYNWAEGIKKAYHENESVTNPGGGMKAAMGAAVQPITSIPGSIKELVTHPINSFENAPVSTLMAGYGAAEGGLGLAKIAKKGMTSSIPEIVTKAGGEFKGIQKGAGGIPDTVMFNDATGSTKMLAVDKVSPKNISKVLTNKIDYLGKPINQPTLDTSKVLSKMSGVQHSTIEGLADPEMRKWMTPDLGLKAENIEGDVLKSIKELPKGLSKAESKIYQNLGITNDTPTIWNKPIGEGETAITPIEKMRASIDQFKEMATTDEMPIASKADEIVNKIIKDSTFDKDKNMVLPFGKSKAYSSKLYDLAQSENPLEAKLYNQMYQAAKVAKNSMPEVAKAGNAFRNIEEARELMRNSFRGFGVEGREFRVEKGIYSRYKDAGNIGFKENMDKVGEILNQYPETKELADFSKKVKLMNMATDFEKAKIPAGLFGKLGRMIKPSPANIMSMSAKMADKGILNVGALKGTIPESQIPFLASPINKYMAIKSIFTKGAK